MDETIPVTYYGVHVDRTCTPYLHQRKDGKGYDAYGEGTPSPYEVRQRNYPPHRIQLGYVGNIPKLPAGFLNNPIVDFYLPKPVIRERPTIAFVRGSTYDEYHVFAKLAELSGIQDLTVRVQNDSEKRTESDLCSTNLTPLTLLGWIPSSTTQLYRTIEFAATQRRKLMLVVNSEVPVPSNLPDLTDAYLEVRNSVIHMPVHDIHDIGNLFFNKHIRTLK